MGVFIIAAIVAVWLLWEKNHENDTRKLFDAIWRKWRFFAALGSVKNTLLVMLLTIPALTVSAQKQVETKTRVTTESTYENAQARVPQVVVTPKVKPLTCEIEILTDAEHYYEVTLERKVVEVGLEGNLDNVYNYGTFLWTKKVSCDMIVAPTYHIKQLDTKDYLLEIKGFPANFVKWRTVDENDYEWLRITEGYYYSNGVLNPLIRK